jgi:hypothetical protein
MARARPDLTDVAANCWDNACSETLFGSLKVERLHGKRFKTRARGEGRNHRLAALVQPRPAALYAGIRQPDAVRAGLACQSATASQLMNSAMGYGFQGQGQGGNPAMAASVKVHRPKEPRG